MALKKTWLWHALACSGNGKPGSLRVMEGPKNLGLSPENLTQGPGFVSYGRCFFFKLHGWRWGLGQRNWPKHHLVGGLEHEFYDILWLSHQKMASCHHPNWVHQSIIFHHGVGENHQPPLQSLQLLPAPLIASQVTACWIPPLEHRSNERAWPEPLFATEQTGIRSLVRGNYPKELPEFSGQWIVKKISQIFGWWHFAEKDP